jgi:hypothetical protein
MPERRRANRVAVQAVLWQIVATAVLIGAVDRRGARLGHGSHGDGQDA